MSFDVTTDQMRALMAPLSPNRVKSRSQGGRSLSYLEAWDVKATLIRVFGFGGFDSEVTRSEILKFETDIPKKSGGGTTAFRVTAMSTVRLTIHGTQTEVEGGYLLGRDAVYEETAIASQAGADPGEVADFAMKTATSDALKRCAIHLGTQFGLSLYDNGSTQDVIRVLVDPRQKAVLEEVRAGAEQAHAAQVAHLQERIAGATARGEQAEGEEVPASE